MVGFWGFQCQGCDPSGDFSFLVSLLGWLVLAFTFLCFSFACLMPFFV